MCWPVIPAAMPPTMKRGCGLLQARLHDKDLLIHTPPPVPANNSVRESFEHGTSEHGTSGIYRIENQFSFERKLSINSHAMGRRLGFLTIACTTSGTKRTDYACVYNLAE